MFYSRNISEISLEIPEKVSTFAPALREKLCCSLSFGFVSFGVLLLVGILE